MFTDCKRKNVKAVSKIGPLDKVRGVFTTVSRDFLKTFYELLTTLNKLLMSLLQTSYEIVTNFL
jgi:hypothetical protein